MWACWRYREVQTVHIGANKGSTIETSKRPLRHLARFILIGLYTGTRSSAIAASSPVRSDGSAYVELDEGIFYRLAQGQRATNRRQPPVPLPHRVLAHLRRWRDKGIANTHFVEFNGKPVKSVKTAFKSAVRLAKLGGGVTPHTLRHTAATWLMQRGVGLWQAAGYLGMSVETLARVYGHHHPDHVRDAAKAIGYAKPKGDVLGNSLAQARRRRPARPQVIEKIGGACSHVRTRLSITFPCYPGKYREFRTILAVLSTDGCRMRCENNGLEEEFPADPSREFKTPYQGKNRT